MEQYGDSQPELSQDQQRIHDVLVRACTDRNFEHRYKLLESAHGMATSKGVNSVDAVWMANWLLDNSRPERGEIGQPELKGEVFYLVHQGKVSDPDVIERLFSYCLEDGELTLAESVLPYRSEGEKPDYNKTLTSTQVTTLAGNFFANNPATKEDLEVFKKLAHRHCRGDDLKFTTSQIIKLYKQSLRE